MLYSIQLAEEVGVVYLLFYNYIVTLVDFAHFDIEDKKDLIPKIWMPISNNGHAETRSGINEPKLA